jgi:two-component system, OmpR family, KDP operon response regulator KdpE
MSIHQHHDTEATSGADVLVIEDERPIRQFLRVSLTSHGYQMSEVGTGSAGVMHALQENPDIVILDLGLPDMDGIEVIRQIRESSHVPIIVISARDRTTGGVAALNAGANDYMRKPIDTGELLRRIEVLIRFARLRVGDADDKEFVTEHLHVDCTNKRVYLDDREIQLSATEFGILHSLIIHAGGVVTVEQLQREQRQSQGTVDEFQLRALVQQLRRKIDGSTIPPRYILAEPGIGYRLEVS